MKTQKIELTVRDSGSCVVIKDPTNDKINHIEAYLPFNEAIKLKRGNANVRQAEAKKKPFRAMLQTVEQNPDLFHIKNRGITYICNGVDYDEKTNKITIRIPDAADYKEKGEAVPRFGIADGGHTYEVINRTVEEEKDYEAIPNWHFPFVRVHILVGEKNEEIESVVEALNTSLQVQQYTMDEYQNKFEWLKRTLRAHDFDLDNVAFRENEDKDWHVIEVIQRLACFLKDRWGTTEPAGMYKSKNKALKLYTNEDTRSEFKRLEKVVTDVITLPEYIQSEFSKGDAIPDRNINRLKVGVKALRKPWTRPGTDYTTMHKIDMAALLPMASAFREALTSRNDKYEWRYNHKELFQACAVKLFDHLAARISKLRVSSQLGSDIDYWSGCTKIVLNTLEDMRNEKPEVVVRKRKPVEDGNGDETEVTE